MARLIRAAALALMLLVVQATPSAAADGEGIVRGVLLNGTADGSSTAAQEVWLVTYVDNAELSRQTVASDDGGAFQFSGLATDPKYGYGVSVTFQGADYSRGLFSFPEGETAISVEVTVYDSTSDASLVTVASAHTIVYLEEDGLYVYEMVLFDNAGDRTYIGSEDNMIGEERQTVRFSLPYGAGAVEIISGLTGCCLFVTEYGFVHTIPVPPGRTEVAYSYPVARDSGAWLFSREAFYPTAQYSLLIESAGVDVEALGLLAEESMQLGDVMFAHYTAGDIPVGGAATATITRQSSGLPPFVWALLGVVLAVGMAGLIYSRGRKRPLAAAIEEPVTSGAQDLLAQMARLDDAYEEGDMADEEYHRLRGAAKSRLLEMMRNSAGDSGRAT